MGNPQAERITRVIDFRIPLPYLIGGCVTICWALISMYFQLGTLVKTVSDLQIDVKAGNNSVVAVAGELALMKFRTQNVEDELKRQAEAVLRMQQSRSGK